MVNKTLINFENMKWTVQTIFCPLLAILFPMIFSEFTTKQNLILTGNVLGIGIAIYLLFSCVYGMIYDFSNKPKNTAKKMRHDLEIILSMNQNDLNKELLKIQNGQKTLEKKIS